MKSPSPMYSINVTCFTQGGNSSDYLGYTDLELYYSYFLLHEGMYSQAVVAFANANRLWNGIGFQDAFYNASMDHSYSSYKLAVDLIVYRALMANSSTMPQAKTYNSTIAQVESMMSKLQTPDGGVITNYQILNNQIVVPSNAFENGETTSLFVLAD